MRRVAAVALAALSLAGAAPAHAKDFFGRRLELHGYYEMRFAVGWKDFGTTDAWDVCGWQHVLDLEADAQLAPGASVRSRRSRPTPARR